MRRSSRRCAAKPKEKQADSGEDEEDKDFQDSGSEASVGEASSSESDSGSESDFVQTSKAKSKNKSFERVAKTPKFKPKPAQGPPRRSLGESLKKVARCEENPVPITAADLTEHQKLLPDVLNLSEDSDSEDETPSTKEDKKPSLLPLDYETFVKKELDSTVIIKKSQSEDLMERLSASESDSEAEATEDPSNVPPEKKLNFQHLHEHSKRIEETRKSVQLYNSKNKSEQPSYDVGALLALGETEPPAQPQDTEDLRDSEDSDDFEEVNDAKPHEPIPKSGIQVVVDLPSGASKKDKKKLDLEMMLRRRINKTKKEYQIYMHKVHVLAWIAHGNFVNRKLSDPSLMAAALSMIPSQHCYPSGRVNIKYLEQITKWYSEAVLVKENPNDAKYRKNAPALLETLSKQIAAKQTNSRKNKVLIFISLLRSLGIKCRLVLSFRVVPLKPSAAELCSLSTKKPEEKKQTSKDAKSKEKGKKSKGKVKKPSKDQKIPQLDGADDNLFVSKTRASKTRAINSKQKPKSSTNLSKVTKNDVGASTSKSVQNGVGTPTSKSSKPNKNGVGASITKSDKKKVNTPDKNGVGGSLSKLKRNKLALSPSKSSKPDKNVPGPSTSSYWDQVVAKVSPVKEERRISHRDLQRNSKAKVEDKKISNGVHPEAKKNSKLKLGLAKPKAQNSKSQSTKKAQTKKNDDKNASKYFETIAEEPTTSKHFDDAVSSSSSLRTKRSKINICDSTKKHSKPKRSRKDSSASDADFVPATPRISRLKTDEIDRRVLSTDDEHSPDNGKKNGTNAWCEAYVEEEEQWISVDVIKGQVHCVNQIYSRANHPVTYVVSWDTSNHVKDITQRYVQHWNTVTRKLRVDAAWYEEALKPWKAPAHLRDRREDEQLDRMQMDAPLPQSIAEFKNHPLYALKRHLLKFEAIYPPNAVSLGFVKNEAVYARECVHVCRSRDTWLKEAKVVRLGEKPYKIVKARPKYDKLSGKVITDLPLEVFGPWQVEDYVPPRAENGKVPRNPYGNVELFKACMLPGGTVHLVLPNLHKVARKLNIDCVPAMVGFDCHSGWTHPVFDGYVVCEEFKDELLAAWEEEQEAAEQRANEKVERRVYGNWRKLIKGLLIRERLQKKYDFQDGSLARAGTSGFSAKRSSDSAESGNKKQKTTSGK